jgi:hypothetical protein
MNMKVLEVAWFNSWNGCLGVVLAEDETMGYRCAYFDKVDSGDEEQDMRNIMAEGAKLTLQQAKGFFPGWDLDKTYKGVKNG